MYAIEEVQNASRRYMAGDLGGKLYHVLSGIVDVIRPLHSLRIGKRIRSARCNSTASLLGFLPRRYQTTAQQIARTGQNAARRAGCAVIIFAASLWQFRALHIRGKG
jgi:hypothetical protein